MGEEKQVVFLGEEIREKINKAIDKLATAVKVTLGPKGRNVIIRKELNYYLTKDGVSVAKSIYTYDPVEQIVLDLMKDVALETNKIAGDGTTTAITLAEVILKDGLKKVEEGKDPGEIKSSLELSLKLVLGELTKLSKPVEDTIEGLMNVATISANNNQKIGKVVAEAISMSNENSVIDIKESPTKDTFVKEQIGYSFEMSGYLNKDFINTGQKVVLDDVKVLIIDDKVNSITEFKHILDTVANNKGNIVIVARDFTEDVVRILLYNYRNKVVNAIPVKIPGIRREKTDNANDLAAFTGSDLFTRSEKFPHMPQIDRIIIDKYATTFINNSADTTDAIKNIKKTYENIEASYDENRLKKRLSNLSGKTATIYVGGESELEIKETIDRVEDAVNATRAAKEDGILPGGGAALYWISKDLEDVIDPILANAMKAPLETIVNNATTSKERKEEILKSVDENERKYVAYEPVFDVVVSMLESEIIDPTKVTKEALKNAVAIGSMLLTTEGLVLNEF